jgi:hypothetical protein
MSVRLDRPFRAAVLEARTRLLEGDRIFFDLLCSAGQLCYRLPHDDINVRYVSGGRDPRRRLAREFAGMRRETGRNARNESWTRVGARVARLLRGELDEGDGDARSRPLRVLLAYTPGALAPDCSVPRDPVMGAAWKSVVGLFDGLFPSGARSLGSLACVSPDRLARLRRESEGGVRKGRRASGVRAGPEGRSLAVDPSLMAEVGKALGQRVSPGYQARYLFYTRAGDHFWPHPDDPQYALQLLLCVDHRLPPGASSGSAFLGYGRTGSVKRYPLRPGEALAVAPGLVHGREPMKTGERLVMLSIGLQAAPGAANGRGKRRATRG